MSELEFTALRERARDLIQKARLPGTTRPDNVSGHTITRSTRCVLCDIFAEPGECFYEVHAQGKGMGSQIYGFHFLCHAAWQLEAAGVKRAPAPNKPTPPS
jgi:hypothetical protein